MKRTIIACLTLTTILSQANAQTYDYDVLESLFGEPVTTSATGKPEKASDAPVDIEIMTYKEIQRSGAKDIPALLRRFAGVEVKRSFTSSADVSIRGYSQDLANRLLVLIDGRQVLVDSIGSTPWGLIPVQMHEIRQIEVVKGPNSSLYGFNAQGGVINIITFQPLKNDIDEVTLKTGTQRHRQASGSATIQIKDNLAARLGAEFVMEDGFNRDSLTSVTFLNAADFYASHNAHEKRHASADFDWQINETENLRFIANKTNGKSDGSNNFGVSGNGDADMYSYHLDYKNQSNLGLWNFKTYLNSYTANGSVVGHKTDVYVAKIENLSKPMTNNTLRLGTEYRYNKLEGGIIGGTTPGFENNRFEYDLWAANAMWDWHINDNLNWMNAIRYDHLAYKYNGSPSIGPHAGNADAFDRVVEEISFNSGFVYKLDEYRKWRLSVARGLHLPSLIETGASLPLGPLQFVGDPTIQTERNLTAEIGYSHKLKEDDTTLNATLYWSHLNNVVGPTVSGAVYSFSNVGDSESIGLELSAKGKFNDQLQWGSAYTYVSVSDEAEDDGISQNNFEGNQPKHQFSIWGDYQINDKWQLASDLHYVSGHNARVATSTARDPDLLLDERINDYFILNAKLGYKVNNCTEVALEGYNLVEKHREGTGGAAGSFSNNSLGKSILLSIKRKF